MLGLLALAPCLGAFRDGSALSASSLLRHAAPWATGHRYAAPPLDAVGSDRAHQFEPWLIWASKEIRAGRMPLWCPAAYCGMPFIGSMQTAVFSPFNVPAYVLPLPTALAVAAALKLLTAGLGMFVFLRLLGLGHLPSFIGGLTFMRCGFVMSWLGWSLGQVAVWMPWVLAATERLRLRRRARDAAWLAAAVCLQWLGGHPETSFHLLLAAGAFAVWRAVDSRNGRWLGGWSAGILLGTAAAALQLLPLAETLRESATLAFRGGHAVLEVVERQSFILFFVPDYYGSRPAGTAWENWFCTDYNEISGYAGLLPWLLLPCALLSRDRRARFFTLMAAVAIGTVYRVPLLPRLVASLPGLSLTVNIRFLLVIDFALAVIVALGAQAVLSSAESARRRMRNAAPWVAGAYVAYLLAQLAVQRSSFLWIPAGRLVAPRIFIAVVLLVAGTLLLRRWLRVPADRIAPGGLLALQLWSCLTFATVTLTPIPAADVYPVTPAIQWLTRHAKIARAVTAGPNLGGVYGWREISGYNAMNPRRVSLLITDPAHLGIRGNECPPFTASFSGPVPRVLNLGYVMRAPEEASPGPGWHPAYRGPDATIWSPATAPPRTWMVFQARTAPDEAAELALTKSGVINPTREVLLPSGSTIGPETRRAQMSGQARLTVDEPSRVTIDCDAESEGWLVLADAWAPGWRVDLDGLRARLLRADGAIRAVRVSAGRHTVQFQYDPLSFKAGLLISGLSLGLAMILALCSEVRGLSRTP